MNFLDPILGFAVLTGPLWLIVVATLVAIGLSVWISKRYAQRGTKIAIKAVIFLFAFLILFGDEIAGRIYLNHLCATEAGVKVYQTVELPAEYWDEQGRPKFFNKHGNLEHQFWLKEIDESDGRTERSSSTFPINKYTTKIKQKNSQLLLAETTTYIFRGGWLSRNFDPSSTASGSCAQNSRRMAYGQIFKPAVSSK